MDDGRTSYGGMRSPMPLAEMTPECRSCTQPITEDLDSSHYARMAVLTDHGYCCIELGMHEILKGARDIEESVRTRLHQHTLQLYSASIVHISFEYTRFVEKHEKDINQLRFKDFQNLQISQILRNA